MKCRISITGRKIWRDGNNIAGKRPDNVEILLFRDDVEYKKDTLSSKGDGVYSFVCLPVYKAPGKKYIYGVDEKETPAGYTKTIDRYNIVNTIEQGSITIRGTKKWVDNNNQSGNRPQGITVLLLQNGNEFRSEHIDSPPNEDDTVDFSFVGVPQFDAVGTPYVYTVDEEDVEHYSKSITGFNIVNTIEP